MKFPLKLAAHISRWLMSHHKQPHRTSKAHTNDDSLPTVDPTIFYFFFEKLNAFLWMKLDSEIHMFNVKLGKNK